MHRFFSSPFNIGDLTLDHRLIQAPLAGYSCAPFRQLFYRYTPPAYCVTEMISAQDVLHKHQPDSRFLYRAPEETRLCYQLSGHDPETLAQASMHVEALGADLIDLNAGCPKPKIRKKGAGSALLQDSERLLAMICAMKKAITIPLTVKLRITDETYDLNLVQAIEQAGADAVIVHGRRWIDDYDIACDLERIANIKRAITIPVIANGDIADKETLYHAYQQTGCDGFMIGRAGSGKPWLYQQLLTSDVIHPVELHERIACFLLHLEGLADLESEHKAVLQSKSLVRYYFKDLFSDSQLQVFYHLPNLLAIKNMISNYIGYTYSF